MRSWLVGIALSVAAVVAGGAVLAGGAAGQAPFPPCPPGTAPIPSPTVTVTADPGAQGRFVAGRPFVIGTAARRSWRRPPAPRGRSSRRTTSSTRP